MVLSSPLSPSEDVCKRGFTVIIDMRGSKWDLIKPLLKTLQEAFPAEICVALIIKPDNFWQKQKTNFGSAKFTFEVSLSLSIARHGRKHNLVLVGMSTYCPGLFYVSSVQTFSLVSMPVLIISHRRAVLRLHFSQS